MSTNFSNFVDWLAVQIARGLHSCHEKKILKDLDVMLKSKHRLEDLCFRLILSIDDEKHKYEKEENNKFYSDSNNVENLGIMIYDFICKDSIPQLRIQAFLNNFGCVFRCFDSEDYGIIGYQFMFEKKTTKSKLVIYNFVYSFVGNRYQSGRFVKKNSHILKLICKHIDKINDVYNIDFKKYEKFATSRIWGEKDEMILRLDKNYEMIKEDNEMTENERNKIIDGLLIEEENIKKIQKTKEEKKQRKKTRQDKKIKIENNASIQIQCAIRCFFARTLLKNLKQKHKNKNATTIQHVLRNYCFALKSKKTKDQKARVIQKAFRTHCLQRANEEKERKIKENARNFLMQLSYKTRFKTIPVFFEGEMFCINAPINSDVVRMHDKNPNDLLGELMKMTPSKLSDAFNFMNLS